MDFNELVAKEFMELHREILAEQKKTNELLGRIIQQNDDMVNLSVVAVAALVAIQATVKSDNESAQRLAMQHLASGLDEIIATIKPR